MASVFFPVIITVMMTITVEDYETQYWPKLHGAIQQLLTMRAGDSIHISYEQMYRYANIIVIIAGYELRVLEKVVKRTTIR